MYDQMYTKNNSGYLVNANCKNTAPRTLSNSLRLQELYSAEREGQSLVTKNNDADGAVIQRTILLLGERTAIDGNHSVIGINFIPSASLINLTAYSRGLQSGSISSSLAGHTSAISGSLSWKETGGQGMRLWLLRTGA